MIVIFIVIVCVLFLIAVVAWQIHVNKQLKEELKEEQKEVHNSHVVIEKEKEKAELKEKITSGNKRNDFDNGINILSNLAKRED